MTDNNVAQSSNTPTEKEEFKPTPHMIVWLDTAIRIQSDSPTEIANACEVKLDRTNWYEWLKRPGFEDWYYEEYKRNRRRWIPTLDKIGMRNAQRDFNYWEAMNKKVGDLDDKPNVAVQVNNVIGKKKEEYGF